MNALLPSLSVVMPCLNEEKNIEAAVEATLHAFDLYGLDAELIVVNDGSTDQTPTVVKRLMAIHSRVRMLHHAKPWGVGGSFWDGVTHATKDYVTCFPGDNENDPVDALISFHMAKHVDIIVPFIHNIDVRSYKRRLLSSCYRFIINMSYGTNLNYTNGTIIYNRKVLLTAEPVSKGFFYQAEMLIRLIRAGYLYAETPHFLSKRNFGTSKAISLKSLLNVMQDYFRLMINVHIKTQIGHTDQPLYENSMTRKRLSLIGGAETE